jgi:hypothetical protein
MGTQDQGEPRACRKELRSDTCVCRPAVRGHLYHRTRPGQQIRLHAAAKLEQSSCIGRAGASPLYGSACLQCVPNHLYIGSNAPSPPGISATNTASSPLSAFDRIKATVGQVTTGTAEDNAQVSATYEFEGFPWRAEVDFLNADLTTHTIGQDTIRVNTSGVYSMWFVTCDPRLTEVRTRLRVPDAQTLWFISLRALRSHALSWRGAQLCAPCAVLSHV